MSRKNLVSLCLLTLMVAVWIPQVSAQCTPPQVLIVLDKSSSMETGYVNAEDTKWMAATAAVESLVTSYGDRIDFGLMVYPYTSECQPGQVVVDVGEDTAADIIAALVDSPPTGGNWTPMSQSLDEVALYAPLQNAGRDNFVLLVTDGWQYCEPHDVATRYDAVDSVQALTALGIQTFVLGFGAAVDVLNNNLMAEAGLTALPNCDPEGNNVAAADLCYYQTLDQQGLESAFDEIALELTGETCNGEDDDCDGFTDNQVEGSSAPLSEIMTSACGGTCESICQGGQWQACQPEGPCDDGDACTSGDWCSGDVCAGQVVDCDDGIECTSDSCDSGSGCANRPVHESCDDGDPCTQDTCGAQGCSNVFVSGPCDDGNLCTLNDVCVDGIGCTGVMTNCDDGNPCTDDLCDPETGCHYSNNGHVCEDGDPCTQGDVCVDGSCVAGDDVCTEGGDDKAADCGCASSSGSPLSLLWFLLPLFWRLRHR